MPFVGLECGMVMVMDLGMIMVTVLPLGAVTVIVCDCFWHSIEHVSVTVTVQFSSSSQATTEVGLDAKSVSSLASGEGAEVIGPLLSLLLSSGFTLVSVVW